MSDWHGKEWRTIKCLFSFKKKKIESQWQIVHDFDVFFFFIPVRQNEGQSEKSKAASVVYSILTRAHQRRWYKAVNP